MSSSLALRDRLQQRQLTRAERAHLWKLSGPAALERDGKIPEIPVALGCLCEELLNFVHDSGRSGFFLLRNLEIGELPPTHSGGHPTKLSEHGTSGTLRIIAEMLGSMIGYADEKDGALIHEVQPIPGEEDRIENCGSVAFDFHTENVHHPLRPDFLGLLCLRQDHEDTAATRIASVREAIDLLDASVVQTLREAHFYSNYPSSFTRETGEEPAPAGPHPVIFGGEHRAFFRFNSHNTFSVTPRGRQVLQELTEVLEQVCHDVVLRPGDCVLIDNNVAAHGRSAFVPRYDGQDRWLRRFYSIRSIPRSVLNMMDGSSVVPTMSEIRGIW